MVEITLTVFVPQLVQVVDALQALKEQLMADFSGLHNDLAGLQAAITEELVEIQLLLDDTADQAHVEEARVKVQELTAAVQHMAPPPPQP